MDSMAETGSGISKTGFQPLHSHVASYNNVQSNLLHKSALQSSPQVWPVGVAIGQYWTQGVCLTVHWFQAATQDSRLHRSDHHFDIMCTAMSGGPIHLQDCVPLQALTSIIAEKTFQSACRVGSEGQNMRFLRAICLQPYLALVQASSHDSLEYDPSKTEIRFSSSFSQCLMQTIVRFALDNHLPANLRPKPPDAPPSAPPATPPLGAARRKKVFAKRAANEEASTLHPDLAPRKSARQHAPPDPFVPTTESHYRSPKSREAGPKSVPDAAAVSAAAAAFQPKAQKLVEEIGSAADHSSLTRLLKQLKARITSLENKFG